MIGGTCQFVLDLVVFSALTVELVVRPLVRLARLRRAAADFPTARVV